MAQCAILGKAGRRVIRVGCSVVVLKMTLDAVRRSPLKYKVLMTLAALQQGVRPIENKPGESPVIEQGKPSIRAVAPFTFEREIRGHMIDRYRVDVVRMMTGIAICLQPAKLPDSGPGMADFAFNRDMGAHERETVRMQCIAGSYMLPAPDAVALGTVCAHPAPVDIGVTVGAIRSDV